MQEMPNRATEPITMPSDELKEQREEVWQLDCCLCKVPMPPQDRSKTPDMICKECRAKSRRLALEETIICIRIHEEEIERHQRILAELRENEKRFQPVPEQRENR